MPKERKAFCQLTQLVPGRIAPSSAEAGWHPTSPLKWALSWGWCPDSSKPVVTNFYWAVLRRGKWESGKNPDAGKDWWREEKVVTEDEMVWWRHRLNGHEFEQTLGDGEGQGSLVCCSPWGFKELKMTERRNNNITEPQMMLTWNRNPFLI